MPTDPHPPGTTAHVVAFGTHYLVEADLLEICRQLARLREIFDYF